MTRKNEEIGIGRRTWLQAACIGAAFGAAEVWGQTPQDGLKQPVFRVAKRGSAPVGAKPDPLDPALEMARKGLAASQAHIRDYTCKIVKRERINGKVGKIEVMDAKIRNSKVVNDRVTTRFGVYLKFLSPKAIKGRQVLYVDGLNNGKLLAKEGGNLHLLPAVWLSPTGALAMRGQLYPLTEIGIENLMAKLIVRGNREKAIGGCEVSIRKGFKVNDRVCTLIELRRPTKGPKFEFNVAQIFVDEQLQVPIRYAAYDWPKKAGAKGEVIEEYTYLDVKVNVGITDADFDRKMYGF
jgi:hypothetical protein